MAKSQPTVFIYADVISESFPAEDLEECSQKFVTIYWKAWVRSTFMSLIFLPANFAIVPQLWAVSTAGFLAQGSL